MAAKIYSKPILFTLMVTLAVLAGSIVMMAYPMLRADMHPKLENLRPFTALQLAGRDIYQREGCVNCHTPTVRPLRTEVMRPSSGDRSGPARTWRVKGASARTPGTWPTSRMPRRSCRAPTCRPTAG